MQDNSNDIIHGLKKLLEDIQTSRNVDVDRLRRLAAGFVPVAQDFYEVLTEIETAARKVSSREELQTIYPIITEALGRDGLGHGVMFRAKRNGASLEGTASFRSSVSMMARRRQLNRHFGPETYVTDKMLGEKFARGMGIRTALKHDWVFDSRTLPLEPGTVVKPRGELGSKGVFIFGHGGSIFDVQKSEYRGTEEEVRQILDALVSKQGNTELIHGRGRVNKDQWIVEHAIFDAHERELPARDLKFFVFYGKVALVLEIMRFPERRNCWWDAYGNRVKTGIYDEPDWIGSGVSQDEIDHAALISAEIPGPFLRIDFLRGEEGLVLGEFSGGAGDYNKFTRQWDQKLGDMFLEAEGRLTADLLNGRTFSHYQELLSTYYRHYRAIRQGRFVIEGATSPENLAEHLADYCTENQIRGFITRGDQDALELVARTGQRRLTELENYLGELADSAVIERFTLGVYRGVFPGQLTFRNNVR